MTDGKGAVKIALSRPAHQRVTTAVGALEIFKNMREVETWKTNGIAIGAPALTSSLQDEKAVEEAILHTPFVRQYLEYVLSIL